MTTLEISKQEAIGMYRNKNRLAKALGITRQAVEGWPDDKPIPIKQALLLRYVLRPELFEESA